MLQPRTIFASDYQIDRPLGAGGMGTLYVVDQLSTGRKRALKLMHPDLVKDERLRARFEQEAKVGSRIESDHVVQVLAAGVDEATQSPYIVMELLSGETMTAYVTRRGPLPPAEVLELFRELCHALAAAHGAGVVHRDIKPDNVFLSTSKRADGGFTVKVLDFGIAKLVAEAKTSATAAMGTPLWMAPEQSDPRARITPATDVWAVGLLAFWALSGRSYWRGAADEVSVQAVMREVLFEPLDPASKRSLDLGGPGLPFGFDAWFARAVARAEGDRFPDAAVAYAALEAVLSGRPMPTAPGPTAPTLPGGAPPETSGPVGATVFGGPPGSAAFQVAPMGVSAGYGATQPGGPSGPVPTAPTLTSHAPSPQAQRPSSKWGLILGLGVAALGALGVGGYFVLGPGASKKSAVKESRDDDERERRPRHSAEPVEPSAAPWAQEAAIPVSSGDAQLGPKDAPVTLVVFADFQCAFCKKLDPTLKELRTRYGDDLRVVWKDRPLDMLPTHANAKKIAIVMQTVFARKGNEAFWRVHDKLFERQSELSDMAVVLEIVKAEAGLEAKALDEGAAAATAEVALDEALAVKVRATGTPTSFINGISVSGAVSTEQLVAKIDPELEAAKKAIAGGTARDAVYQSRVAANYVEGGPDNADAREDTLFEVDPEVGKSPTLGSATAPVTVVEFSDFQCPYCRKVAPTLKRLVTEHPQEVRLAFKHRPLKFHDRALPAANVAIEAMKKSGAPGFWEAYDKLMDPEAKDLSDATLERVVAELRLPKDALTCAASNCNKATIDAENAEAERAHVSGIPTMFINGRLLSGARPYEDIEAIVLWEAAKAASPSGANHRAAFERVVGVKLKEPRKGGGPLVLPGKKLKLRYVGKLADGTVFDQTEPGRTFEVTFNPGQLVPGFEEALAGMREGAKRVVTMPASAGYGPNGRPPKIPPNAALTFEIELVSVL